MENDFLDLIKFFQQVKSHFLSISRANMKFLGWEKIFCPDKNILSRQMEGALGEVGTYTAGMR